MFHVCKGVCLVVGEQILQENFYEFPVYILYYQPYKGKK